MAINAGGGIGYTFRDGDWTRLRQIIQQLSSVRFGYNAAPVFNNLTISKDASSTGGNLTVEGNISIGGNLTISGDLSLTGTFTIDSLTAERLVSTNSDKEFASVSTLSSWVAGTANQVSVSDDGDGTITLATPQDIHTGASPEFTGLTLSGLTENSIPYIGSGGVLSEESSNFNWLPTNNILSISDGSMAVVGTPNAYHLLLAKDFPSKSFIITVGDTEVNFTSSLDLNFGNDDATSTGTWTLGNIIDSGLTANQGVYTDGSKQLTSTPPSSGTLGHWDRTGTVLSPANANDTLDGIGGTLTLASGSITESTGTIDFSDENLTTTGKGTFGNFQTDLVTINGGTISLNSNLFIANVGFGSTITAYDNFSFYGEGSMYFDNAFSFMDMDFVCEAVIRFTTSDDITFLASNSNFNHNIKITADNKRLYVGAGNDLEIYHNGTNSIIDNNTGRLDITGSVVRLANALYFTQTDGAERISSDVDGTLDLYAGTSIDLHNSNANTDLALNFIGTTNSGVLTWMEDEDYFRFSDDVLLDTTENLYFRDTAIHINSGADGYMDLVADTGVRIGDGGTTNYSKFESDGTLEFNGTATVWKDINLGAANVRAPSSGYPDIDEFVDSTGTDTGIETYAFDVGEAVSSQFELQHDYKEGSDVYFHVHWQGIAAPAGGTDNVQWQLEYTVSRAGNTVSATTTITAESAITTQYAQVRTDFSAITGTNFQIGDQFMFKLSRIAASSDEYGGDALFITAGLHYEIDTVGSRTINSK